MAMFYVYGVRKRKKAKPVSCTCGMPGVSSDDCPLKKQPAIYRRPKYLGFVKAKTERKALRTAKQNKEWSEYQLDLIYKEFISDKRSMTMTGPKFQTKKQKSKQKEQ